MLQQQIMDEIKHIPEDRLAELYDFVHYFRLGLQHEKSEKKDSAKYPLRGNQISYQHPTDPVASDDWDSLK